MVFGAEGLRALLDDRGRQRDALAELVAARVEIARLRGEVQGHDTELLTAEAVAAAAAAAAIAVQPRADDVPTGDSELDPDAEPEIERVAEADEAGHEVGYEAGHEAGHGDAVLGAGALRNAAQLAAVDAADLPAGDPPFEPGFDEMPFDGNSFDAEISLDEPMAVPVVSSPPGAPIDAGGRAATEVDAAVEPGDPAALDADADGDAEIEAALDAESGGDAESALADAEAFGPGGSPALLVDSDLASLEAAESLGLGSDPVTTEVAELPIVLGPPGVAPAGSSVAGDPAPVRPSRAGASTTPGATWRSPPTPCSPPCWPARSTSAWCCTAR